MRRKRATIHPVNNFWLRGFKIERIGAAFLAFDPLTRTRAVVAAALDIAARSLESMRMPCAPHLACSV